MPRKIERKPRLTGVVVRQMDQGLQKAKDKYFKSVKLAAEGFDSEYGPWVVAEGIASGLFEMWSAKQQSRWKLAYEDEGGIVLLYGDPSPVHEGTSGFISKSIIGKLTMAGQEAGTDSVSYAPSPLCQLVNSRKKPDFAFCPSDCLEHNPTLVCEVAYGNESMVELRREMSKWTARQDLAQLCLGIFVNTYPEGADLDPYLTILQKSHGCRHKQLSFGRGSACTALNIPQFQFRIPFDKLFARSSLDLVHVFGQRNHITIDLFKVRKEVERRLIATP